MDSVKKGEDGRWLCPDMNCQSSFTHEKGAKEHLIKSHKIPPITKKTIEAQVEAQNLQNAENALFRSLISSEIDGLMNQVVKAGKKFICPLGGCKDPGKKWSSEAFLKNHLENEHYSIPKDINPSGDIYECENCDKRYANTRAFDHHRRTKHNWKGVGKGHKKEVVTK